MQRGTVDRVSGRPPDRGHWVHGSSRHRRRRLRALRRPSAARRRDVPRRPTARAWRSWAPTVRQVDAAADRHRRRAAALRLGRTQRRPGGHAAGRRPDRRRPLDPRPAGVAGRARRPGRGRRARCRGAGRSWRSTTSRRRCGTRRRSSTGPTSAATRPRPAGTGSPTRCCRSRSSGRSTARCARCPAASRSGWCSRRCCAGRTRCCCSTSRTTRSTCRPSAGSRTSCVASNKTVLFVSHDRELLARVATQVATLEPARHGCGGVGARRRVRDVPPGARGPARRGSRSCCGAGRRSTRSSRSSC